MTDVNRQREDLTEDDSELQELLEDDTVVNEWS